MARARAFMIVVHEALVPMGRLEAGEFAQAGASTRASPRDLRTAHLPRENQRGAQGEPSSRLQTILTPTPSPLNGPPDARRSTTAIVSSSITTHGARIGAHYAQSAATAMARRRAPLGRRAPAGRSWGWLSAISDGRRISTETCAPVRSTQRELEKARARACVEHG